MGRSPWGLRRREVKECVVRDFSPADRRMSHTPSKGCDRRGKCLG